MLSYRFYHNVDVLITFEIYGILEKKKAAKYLWGRKSGLH